MSTGVIEHERPKTGCQWSLMLLGGIGALGALGSLGSSTGAALLGLLICGGLCALGVYWLINTKAPPPDCVLKIASATTEEEGMRSPNRDLIERVAAAINDAIVARG